MKSEGARFIIVSDGACRRNPGPGGWGLILITPGDEVFEFGAAEDATTNNRMELMGFYRGLQEIYKRMKDFPECKIIQVISDSKYVLENAAKFVDYWRRNDWKTGSGSDVKNRDIWEKIAKGLDEFKKHQMIIEYELVKGHAGNDGNERADQIAVKFSREEPIDLYIGPLSGYPVSLKTGLAFKPSYLSYIGGVLKRHETWTECEDEIRGKTNVKFKKVKNRMEEQETLKSWGVPV